MQARIIIGERTPKRCRVIKEKIPSNLTVARYLFPVVSCGHFTSYRSHKYTLREKGVKQAVCACTFACDFLLFPLISSVLGTRISLAYICTEKRKTTIKNDIDMRFTAIDTSAWEEAAGSEKRRRSMPLYCIHSAA